MGTCECSPKKRSLTKTWPTNQDLQGWSRNTIPSSTSLGTSKEELEQTAEKLFDRFDQSKNGVLNKAELLSFLRYANKRSGKTKMKEIDL